ncbi:MAG: hypothetical protein M3Z02_05560, partial [Actinomycetota bacterium]|nr:hypothetical protein [Actinomycetota bacterium]
MAGRLASVSSWAVAPLALVLLVAAVVVGGRSLGGDASAWLFVPVSVPFALVGALLTRRRPGNPVGWLIAGWGLVMAYRVFAQAYAGAAASTPDRLPGAEWLAWVGTWLWHPAFSLLAFLLLLFPHGRLVSARARVLVWVIVGTYGLLAVAAALSPSAEDDYFPGSAPPFRSPIGGVADVAFAILLTAQLAVLLAAMASLLIRLRRSDGEERQQIKWFIYTVAVTVVVFVAGVFVLGGGFLFPVFAAIPVSAAVAVLRYRLYDIDRIVSRTVSYAAVTGVLIALYVGLVTAFGQLVGSS